MKHVQKYETSKHAVKSSSTKTHSSILRLSLRQYVEQQTDITFTLFPVSLTFWNLCSASAIQPHFIQSYLICYLSLCTSATQLMCEPCNVLQSGPRFDFIQPFITHFGTYAAPLPSSSYLNLGNSLAIQLILICCMSKLSQQNTSLWFRTFRFRLVLPVTCSKILKSISFMARIVKPFQCLRPPCSSSIQTHSNENCKSQVPDSLFCFSL
jgi:hypothetical protein